MPPPTSTPVLNTQQRLTLVLLTLLWGLNWPVMKLGVSNFPPLTFRTWSMWLGLPVLALGLVLLKVPFRIARRDWPELLRLSVFNMFIWHGCIIIAVQFLSSGRAAILGYTMPIFSALIGAWVFATPLAARAWLGVGAATGGVMLLLWHELSSFAGKPAAVALALIAAAAWALGTQLLRRTKMPVATLTISFWMTALSAVVMTILSLLFERERWHMPNSAAWSAILFNAVLVFGYAHAAWFYLARSLPPIASTLSVMLIPVLGVFSGVWWLNEVLHWQDWAAVALMVVAIASVLWPTNSPTNPNNPRT